MKAVNYFQQNRTLIILSSQMFLIAIGVGVANPVLPQYAKSFGVNIAMIGLIITAFGVTRMVADIPASRLTTRIGRRPVMIIGLVFVILSAFGAGLTNSYWGLLVSWGIHGIGASLFIVAAMLMLADISSTGNRGQMMGTFQGCQLAGSGIGPALGGFVAQFWGYQSVFFVFAAVAVICLFITSFFIVETRDNSRFSVKPNDRSQPEASPSDSRTGIRPLLGNTSFMLVSMVTLGIFIMRISSQNQLLPLLGLERMGLTSGQIGTAMAIIVFSQFVATLICGKLSDRFGRKAIIAPGCLVAALSLLVLSQSYTFGMLILSCVGMGIGVGMAGSSSLAYVADITPRGNHDAGMGLYRAIADSSFVIGPLLLGWMADTGGFSLSLIFNCLLLFVVGIVFQIFSRSLVKSKISDEAGVRSRN
jgi:MFS transporter, DHA1 family, multidrug resistance protein